MQSTLGGDADFSKVLPLDNFRIQNQELAFDDLAALYGFLAPRRYDVRWSRFDNSSQKHVPMPGGDSARLPAEIINARSGTYFSAVIERPGLRLQLVSVYIRKEENGYKFVGIDRTW